MENGLDMRHDQVKSTSPLAVAAAFLLTCATGAAQGGEAAGDKSAYTLFNPTPRSAMREMETDRPDVTESAYTVDAGHLQIEASFVEYAQDAGTEEWDVLPTNIKVGVLNNVDVQIVLSPDQDVSPNQGPHAAGFGDSQLRIKVNLWGNDGGDTALAVMPFVQFPTGESDLTVGHVEYGLIVPFAFQINDKTGMGLMLEADFLRDEENDGWDTSLVHSATIGRELTDQVGMYVEYVGVLPLGGGTADYQAYFDVGMTYALTEDLRLDTGLNVGLTNNAEDLRVFAGISYRL
jgi:hypothetical protein